jgi:hypothetical protein
LDGKFPTSIISAGLDATIPEPSVPWLAMIEDDPVNAPMALVSIGTLNRTLWSRRTFRNLAEFFGYACAQAGGGAAARRTLVLGRCSI